MGVGRSHRQTGDHARPTDPCMHSEAVEGLLEEDILAESCLPFEARAAVGSSEGARWQRKGVRQGEVRIVRGFGHKFLPEALLSFPQVGCLPGEGGAMHPPQIREEVGVVTPEVRKEFGLFVYPQELAYDLDGEDFGVAEIVGAGPRALRRPRSLIRSSMRQKTATMKVLRSTRAKTSFSLR